jgi:hypothetical protein
MHTMRTYSLVAAAFVVFTSVTACGNIEGPTLPPSDYPAALNGRVVASEMEADAGLAEAIVTATRDGSTYSTRTNDNGEFEFTELSPGEWTLSVSRDGYLDKTQSVYVDRTDEGLIVAVDPEPAEPIIDEELAARALAVETR